MGWEKGTLSVEKWRLDSALTQYFNTVDQQAALP
jgi:hypothetical protein